MDRRCRHPCQSQYSARDPCRRLLQRISHRHRRPASEKESADLRHLFMVVELNGIMGRGASKVVLPRRRAVITERSAVTQQVQPVSPQIDVKQVAVGRLVDETPRASKDEPAFFVTKNRVPTVCEISVRCRCRCFGLRAPLRAQPRCQPIPGSRRQPGPAIDHRTDRLHGGTVIEIIAIGHRKGQCAVVAAQIGHPSRGGIHHRKQPATGPAHRLKAAITEMDAVLSSGLNGPTTSRRSSGADNWQNAGKRNRLRR